MFYLCKSNNNNDKLPDILIELNVLLFYSFYTKSLFFFVLIVLTHTHSFLLIGIYTKLVLNF